jgi:outer membrane receptor protein involved in Fe transport
LATAVCLALAAGTAAAQNLEVVVVTATKRGETLLEDTPISVQSIGGQTLAEIGALDFDDFMRRVPSLSISDNGPGDKRIVLRGVSATGAGTVGLYFDEVVITGSNLGDDGGRQPDIKLFDMDRIEVLRGPQGTTFGSSSLSGTIRWLPKAPEYGTFSGELGVRATTLKESDTTGYQYDGVINVPLGERVAVRFAGLRVTIPGYIDGRFGEDLDEESTTAARAMLGWQITDDLEFTAMTMFQKMDLEGRTSFSTENLDLPLSPTLNGQPLPSRYYSSDQSRPFRREDIAMYSGKLIYTKDWGTITAAHSLFDRDSEFARDASAAAEVLSVGALHADSTGVSLIENPQHYWIRSSELRFSSDWDGPIQVLVGAYNHNEDRTGGSRWYSVDPRTGRFGIDSVDFLHRSETTHVDEQALFGEVSWDVTDRITATAGIRWFDFEVGQEASRIVDFRSVPGPGPGHQFEYSESGTTLRFNLAYDLNDDWMTYVQVAEGFRAGGANDQTAASIADVQIPAGFGSDSIVNYELGMKGALADRRLSLSGAIYQIDWTDIQVSQFADSATGLRFTYRGNGGEARVRGAELELIAQPSEVLQFGLGVSYNNSELTEDLPIPTQGLDGDPLPYVPEWTGSINARYTHPLPGGEWEAFIGGDWSYTGEAANRLRSTDRYYRKLEAYDILNLRVGVEGNGWQTVLSVDNVLDADEIITYPFDFQTAAPINGNIPDRLGRPRPRSISIGVRKSFDF